jgi:hypothetical protein
VHLQKTPRVRSRRRFAPVGLLTAARSAAGRELTALVFYRSRARAENAVHVVATPLLPRLEDMSRALRVPLASTVAILVASAAGAQTWDVGVKTGVNRSETPNGSEFSWSGTPSSSFFFSRNLTRFFAIQPELSYFRRSGVSYVGASSLRLVADYLEVPVLLRARPRAVSGFSPFLAAGPSFSIRVRCRLQFSGGGLNTDEDCNEGGTESSILDVGVAGGGGLAWTFAGTTISLESRVTAGLLRNVLPTDVSDARTLHWSVLAGASVPLNGRRVLPPTMPPVRIPLPRLPALPATPSIPEVTESSRATSAKPRVTITADNADAREVLLAIARVGEIDVVVSSEIRARVTAHLIDVPAAQAIQAIAEVTGLGILRPAAPGSATVVFFQPPVNVNRSPAATIASRFGVSKALADYVVETRAP